jgi:hypothetical protein
MRRQCLPHSPRIRQRLRRLRRTEFLRWCNEAAAYLRKVAELASTRPRRSLRIQLTRDNADRIEAGELPEYFATLFGERGFGDSIYYYPFPEDGYWLITKFDWEYDSDYHRAADEYQFHTTFGPHKRVFHLRGSPWASSSS